MVSQSEILLEEVAEMPVESNGASKTVKTRSRRTAPAKKTKRNPARKTPKPAPVKAVRQSRSTGAKITPVMPLRAIDIAEPDKPKTPRTQKGAASRALCPHVIQMPPCVSAADAEERSELSFEGEDGEDGENGAEPLGTPASANGELPVTDPELLELLEQLSVTINTANTVLDAATTLPGETQHSASEMADPGSLQTLETADPETEGAPGPDPEPAPDPVRETEDLPPLARQLAPDPAHDAPPSPAPAPMAARQNNRSGFGLAANMVLTGLVFAAGTAWLLHTNPWLLEGGRAATAKPGVTSVKTEPKLQASLASGRASVKTLAASTSPAPAIIAPPEDDPAAMETPSRPSATPAAARTPARGLAGQPIALNIPLPANADNNEMSVMVQGVPGAAKLSSGKDLGAGNWLLNEAQTNDVALSTAADFKPGTYELEIIVVQSDGKVPATHKLPVEVVSAANANAVAAPAQGAGAGAGAKTLYAKPGVAIRLASAPATPAPQRTASQLAPQEIRILLTRGDTLLRQGDVAGARLLLEYAANSGSKQAMVKLGNSFDPKHLAKLGVRGVQPNEIRAVHWYERAAQSVPRQ